MPFIMIPVYDLNFWVAARRVFKEKMDCKCHSPDYLFRDVFTQCQGCNFWKDIINGNGIEKYGYRWLEII